MLQDFEAQQAAEGVSAVSEDPRCAAERGFRGSLGEWSLRDRGEDLFKLPRGSGTTGKHKSGDRDGGEQCSRRQASTVELASWTFLLYSPTVTSLIRAADADFSAA